MQRRAQRQLLLPHQPEEAGGEAARLAGPVGQQLALRDVGHLERHRG